MVVGERLELEGGTDRCSEQQVLRHRGIGVEPFRIISFDEVGDLVFEQPAGQRLTRFEQPRGRLRFAFGIEAPTQAQTVDVTVRVESGEHLGDAPRQRLAIGDAGSLVIDPIGMDVKIDVAGSSCLK